MSHLSNAIKELLQDHEDHNQNISQILGKSTNPLWEEDFREVGGKERDSLYLKDKMDKVST